MNDQLQKVYYQKFNSLTIKLQEYNSEADSQNQATNPFLLNVPADYTNYQNKIMIFGQETNTWGKECGNNSIFSNNIVKSIEVYENFYLKGGINRYRGPFWNEFKRIKKQISNSENAIFVWNNINKIGRVGKGNIDKINQIQFKYFQVIKEELRILSPNIVIFLTGPDYDIFVKNNIGDFTQKLISDSLFEVKFASEFQNIVFFKTYHPNGLYHLGKNRIVIENLIKEIQNACMKQ